MLKTRGLENIIKGVANHRRIGMLERVAAAPGVNVGELCDAFDVDVRTASVHLRRMTDAGLMIKRSVGRQVEHELTPLGEKMLAFLRSINPRKR